MSPPLRVLRALVADCIGRKPLNETQRQREQQILAVATKAMARYGRHAIRFRTLAQSLRICTDTLRWHFADLDDLLGEILRRHLRALQEALAEIPPQAEGRATRVQATLARITRTPQGAPSQPHLLLLRDRALLPPDVLDPIEAQWANIVATLLPVLDDEALHRLEEQGPASPDLVPLPPEPAYPPPGAPNSRPAPRPPSGTHRLTMAQLNRRAAAASPYAKLEIPRGPHRRPSDGPSPSPD